MPLTEVDRQFVQLVDRIRLYCLGVAGAVLLFLLCSPPNQIHAATAVLGIALCWMLWLTQRLLTLVTLLDVELTRAVEGLKRSVASEGLTVTSHRARTQTPASRPAESSSGSG